MSEQPVPFLDLVGLHKPLEEKFVEVFREAVQSGRFSGGPQVEGFEKEFAEFCGIKYCVGVASGTDAVRFALMACDVRKGDAVVTVSHTFIATVEAICQAGAVPEFVDIDERTYNMSPDALESYLSKCLRDTKTGRPVGEKSGLPIKAIVPVHLYGQVCDMDRILDIAGKYDLVVVEDSAQAHGAEYLTRNSGFKHEANGTWKRAGSFGKAAAFSFYPGKNLGALGEGGAVTTDDEEVAYKIEMIRDHGQAKKYYHEVEGYNGRLDAIQAGCLRIKLRHLKVWNNQRREAADRYKELLFDLSSVALAEDELRKSQIVLPYEPDWSKAVYHLYIIRHSNRDDLLEFLKSKKIYCALHYPVPVHLQNAYSDLDYKEGDFPVTERVCKEILSLPIFPGLSSQQQDRLAQEIEEFAAARIG